MATNEYDQEISDLIHQYRKGEDDAATALYLRYAKQLQSIAEGETSAQMAVRVDPEGIVQSVFRTFFRRVDQGQYDISDPGELWKLLLVMALNKVRATAKSHRAVKRDVSRTVSLEHSSEAAQDNDQALAVLKMTIAEIVENLPTNDRQIIMMRMEGHEVQDIARECGRSKRSVERILQKFRMRLANEIEA